MFEIVIQIKEKDGKFRTIIDSQEKCNDAYLLLPSYVQKIFDAWKNDSPDTKEVCGEKLKSISKDHQVLCVTHLGSIAAKGDFNYYISKNVENNKTKTNIELLNEEKTIKEIARIVSGEITEISLKHAKELRKKWKSENK